MDFPTIHTNFWDAVIAVPSVMIITQILKVVLRVQKKFVPTLAIIIGLVFSVLISHREDLVAGIFMGWFYGYSAIGSYASLKTMMIAFLKKKKYKYAGEGS